MIRFEARVKEYIRVQSLLNQGQSLLLAVSGGIDSMVLLHVFSLLREPLDLHLSVVHVNHQLRGDESMGDEQFVKEMCGKMHVPCYSELIDVMSYVHDHGVSKQLAARKLRYDCFERVRRQTGSDAVATAHHSDDNAETVLLNILRGTGIRGLAGIPPKRSQGSIIRPLLFATRKEIEAYASEQGIRYRNDSSNRSLKYRRNELRHCILPALESRHAGLAGTLNQIAAAMVNVNERMRLMVDEQLHSLFHQDAQGRFLLNHDLLNHVPDFLRDEIFVEILHRLNIEPSEKKISALRRLCTQSTGREMELSGSVSAFHDRGHIVFMVRENILPEMRKVEFGRNYEYRDCHVSISRPEQVPPAYTGTHGVEYIDAGRLGKQLILRPWHAGDWFIPLGMKKRKKLSDFFTDQKVPRYQKTSIPVLESDGMIVWICGKRLDDRFKLTDRTQTAIRLSCRPSTSVTHDEPG